MKRGVVLFIILTLGIANLAMRASHLRNVGKIKVNKYTTVQSVKMIRLKDIAKFDGLPKAAVERLSGIEISTSPDPGEKIYYTSYGLTEIFRIHLSKIQQKYGLRIMLSVPQKVVVYNSAVAFSEDSVKQRIQYHFMAKCNECRYEIHQLQLPQITGDLKSKKWDFEFGHGRLRGGFSFPVYFVQDDGRRKLFWVSGTAKKIMTVPVASRRIEAGERLKVGDFKFQEMDVTFSDDTPAPNKKMINAKLRRSMSAGQILWQKNFQKERAIRFGDITKVLVGNDSWQISLSAVAQQNGDIGDRIKLLNPKTRSYISAKVVGPKLVKVEQF